LRHAYCKTFAKIAEMVWHSGRSSTPPPIAQLYAVFGTRQNRSTQFLLFRSNARRR